MPRRAPPKKPADPRGRRGEGTVRLKGSSWQARWSEDGVRKTLGGFATKDAALTHIDDAQKAACDAAVLAEHGIAPIVPKAPADPKTFRELLPDFLECLGVKPGIPLWAA